MLKPLTMSLSLAVALGLCSVSMAGIGNCSTCGLASPQGSIASPQGAVASPQSCTTGGLCGGGGGKMKGLFSCLHKPKCYTYEWVLKKRRVKGGCGGCGVASCESCGTSVYPSAQGYASPQAYSSGQSYIPTTYGSGQAYGSSHYGGGTYGTTQYGGGSYGTGQYGAPQPSGTTSMAPSTPAPAGDEAPPAPEVAPSTPAPPTPAPPAPAPPAPAPPTGPTSSLLFSTPSGN